MTKLLTKVVKRRTRTLLSSPLGQEARYSRYRRTTCINLQDVQLAGLALINYLRKEKEREKKRLIDRRFFLNFRLFFFRCFRVSAQERRSRLFCFSSKRFYLCFAGDWRHCLSLNESNDVLSEVRLLRSKCMYTKLSKQQEKKGKKSDLVFLLCLRLLPLFIYFTVSY